MYLINQNLYTSSLDGVYNKQNYGQKKLNKMKNSGISGAQI